MYLLKSYVTFCFWNGVIQIMIRCWEFTVVSFSLSLSVYLNGWSNSNKTFSRHIFWNEHLYLVKSNRPFQNIKYSKHKKIQKKFWNLKIFIFTKIFFSAKKNCVQKLNLSNATIIKKTIKEIDEKRKLCTWSRQEHICKILKDRWVHWKKNWEKKIEKQIFSKIS